MISIKANTIIASCEKKAVQRFILSAGILTLTINMKVCGILVVKYSTVWSDITVKLKRNTFIYFVYRSHFITFPTAMQLIKTRPTLIGSNLFQIYQPLSLLLCLLSYQCYPFFNVWSVCFTFRLFWLPAPRMTVFKIPRDTALQSNSLNYEKIKAFAH